MTRDRGCVALFPSSFDPVTNGHLDIVVRSLKMFDQLVLGIAVNVAKNETLSAQERLETLQAVLGDEPRVQITTFDSLTVDFAREIGANVVIRWVRAMSGFEYEFEMALMNKHLYPRDRDHLHDVEPEVPVRELLASQGARAFRP